MKKTENFIKPTGIMVVLFLTLLCFPSEGQNEKQEKKEPQKALNPTPPVKAIPAMPQVTPKPATKVKPSDKPESVPATKANASKTAPAGNAKP